MRRYLVRQLLSGTIPAEIRCGVGWIRHDALDCVTGRDRRRRATHRLFSQSSIIARDRIVAIGLEMRFPAMSGAEPCAG